MSSEAAFNDLAGAVLTFDVDKVIEVTKKARELGINPSEIIEKGLARGLRTVGKKFEDGEIFLLHLAIAAEAVKRALNEVLEPDLLKAKTERKTLGKIVIGTVAGDIHDIGKNLVIAMLFASGFEVYDLGTDVPVEKFVKKAREVKADIVASSALLSTTVPVQREIIKALTAEGIRDRVKVMVGGAPVTEEWAREIGADGYGRDAVDAMKVAKKLLNIAE